MRTIIRVSVPTSGCGGGSAGARGGLLAERQLYESELVQLSLEAAHLAQRNATLGVSGSSTGKFRTKFSNSIKTPMEQCRLRRAAIICLGVVKLKSSVHGLQVVLRFDCWMEQHQERTLLLQPHGSKQAWCRPRGLISN